MTREELLEVLENAPVLSEEEYRTLTDEREELIRKAIEEFNRRADEIDRELEEGWADDQNYDSPEGDV